MAEAEPQVIRSYQRVFRPERRLYQIDGRRLPVPGGVPLRWLGWFASALLAVLALSAGSPVVALAAGLVAGLAACAAGRAQLAPVYGAALGVAVPAAGVVLRLFDWPLRLVVLPALVATLATQATPDGRRADRFAISWLSVRLAPRRQSLGRALPDRGRRLGCGGRLWVAPCHGPTLRRGRVRGPAVVSFAVPVALGRGRLRRGRLVARPGNGGPGAVLELRAGEVLEVHP